MPRQSKAKATEADRRRLDSLLMEQLKIVQKPQISARRWPSHVKRTFEAINKLGSVRFEAYRLEASMRGARMPWRQKTLFRAEEIAETAQRLVAENPTEMKWRIELERLVDGRFASMTECPDCHGRLWRSEMEVVTEVSGPISASLKERRDRRRACECNLESFPGLNPLFSNRADESIRYNHNILPDLEEIRLPTRRPDRVYGLRQTSSFRKTLSNITRSVREAIADGPQHELINNLPEDHRHFIQELIECSPFSSVEQPLLFPFLIIEAKSEEGSSFVNCGIQSAVPIWYFLRIQEVLQQSSGLLSEQGGPFVWYIAYKGDSWRVSGCCTVGEGDNVTYQIIDLWNGRTSSPDEALQLLLIMDYIFDWARDLYRPEIQRLLQSLSEQDFEDSASLITDSDIYSSRRLLDPSDVVSEIESSLGADHHQDSKKVKAHLDAWENLSEFKLVETLRLTSHKLAFRPESIIKSSFQCLSITRENIGMLFAAMCVDTRSNQRMAENIIEALTGVSFFISRRALVQIEQEWTGTVRRDPSGARIMLAVTVDVFLSDEWELVRGITCLAIDEEALVALIRYRMSDFASIMSTMKTLMITAPEIDEAAFVKLVRQLKTRFTDATLGFALKRSRSLFTVEDSWPHIGISHQPMTSFGIDAMDRIKHMVLNIYKVHKLPGILEPPYSYIRFSTRFEQDLADTNLSKPPLAQSIASQTSYNDLVLVLRRDSVEGDSFLSVCLYMQGHHDSYDKVPTSVEMVWSLFHAIKSRKYYRVDENPPAELLSGRDCSQFYEEMLRWLSESIESSINTKRILLTFLARREPAATWKTYKRSDDEESSSKDYEESLGDYDELEEVDPMTEISRHHKENQSKYNDDPPAISFRVDPDFNELLRICREPHNFVSEESFVSDIAYLLSIQQEVESLIAISSEASST